MSTFQPPPTYALPVITDERTGKAIFNPIWLKWFLDLAQGLTAAGAGSGTVSSINVSGGTTGLTASGGPITTTGTITLGGTLGVGNGGTGATSFTSGRVLLGNGAATFSTYSDLSWDSANARLQTGAGGLQPAADGTGTLGNASKHFAQIFLDYTNTAAGTTGARTINKAAGRVNFAAAATSLVVTNSLVTAASKVFALAASKDTSGRVYAVVPAAGSFTIYCTAPAAEMPVNFLVINAD